MFNNQLFSLVLVTIGLALTSGLDTEQTTTFTAASQAQMLKVVQALVREVQYNHERLDYVLQFQDEFAKNTSRMWQEIGNNFTVVIDSQSQSISSQDVLDRLDRIELVMSSLEESTKNAPSVWPEMEDQLKGLLDSEFQVQAEITQDAADRIELAMKSLEESTKNAFQITEEKMMNVVHQTEQKIAALSTSMAQVMSQLQSLQSSIDSQGRTEQPILDLPKPTEDQEQLKTKVFTVVTDKQLNWFEAFNDCKARGLRLATIESEEEQQQVVDLIESEVTDPDYATSFWLSGSDLGSQNGYVWMSTGEPVQGFTAWYSTPDFKEPNHGIYDGEVERCLCMRNGYGYRWNDHRCSSTLFYVCDNVN